MGAGADDGWTYYDPPTDNPGTPDFFSSASTLLVIGLFSGATGESYNTFLRFTGVSGLSGSTINTAILKAYGGSLDSGTPETTIRADDRESPAAPTSKEEHDAITRTTASVTWDNCDLSTSVYVDSPDIKTVIQELADSYDPSVIQICWEDDLKTNTDNRSRAKSYENDTSLAAKLDIDYGGAPAATPYYITKMRGG